MKTGLPMKYFTPLIIFSLLFVGGCSSNEQGDLNLRFRLLYDGEPMIMLQEYNYNGSTDIFFSKFSFFIADLQIINNDNQSYPLTDIEHLDLTEAHEHPSTAERGIELLFTGLESGKYERLDFAIGIPGDLNAKKPADFAPGHPLSENSEYWDGWNSYIFSKTEGRADFDGDGQFEQSLAYHLGSDAVYRNVALAINTEIQEDKTTDLIVTIDLRDMFITGNEAFDIQQTPSTHSLQQIELAKQLADRLSHSFGILK